MIIHVEAHFGASSDLFELHHKQCAGNGLETLPEERPLRGEVRGFVGKT